MAIVDEWEINPGNIMLLEKIGEGFFGVVREAYLYHDTEKRLTLESRIGSDIGGVEKKNGCGMQNVKR